LPTKLEDIRAWLHGKKVKGMPEPYGKESKKSKRTKGAVEWDGKTVVLDVHGFPYLITLEAYDWSGNELHAYGVLRKCDTEGFLRQLRIWKEQVSKKDPDGNKKGFLRTPEWTWRLHRMQLHELQVNAKKGDVLDVELVFRTGNTKKIPTTK